MEKARFGLIRVVTIREPELLHAHGRHIEEVVPQAEVTSVCIEEQPQGVYDKETEALAGIKVLEQALKLESRGMDAVIVSCMADPGVSLLEQHLSIPAVGAGTAGALVALAHAKPVGVLGITDSVPEPIERILNGRLVASVKPAGVDTTVDLLHPEGRQAALVAADRLREAGAELILLGCTGMCTVGLGPDIEKRTGLPVVDPVAASGVLAYFAARGWAARH
ncbi:MAG: aspartate/glutamate racemase family protein [Firmicutes bacterium]|nr:aspartate/glutamate racemase family protein [Bacillota bacterium]